MQELLPKLAKILDSTGETAGRAASWLVPLTLLAAFAMTINRLSLGQSPAFLQDSLTYLHATLIMLGAAYAHKHGAHTRVEALHQSFGAKAHALTELLGCLLLLVPLALAIVWLGSNDVVGAAPGADRPETPIWLKILIPVLGVLLLLQGLASIIRNSLVLTGPSLVGKQEKANDTGTGTASPDEVS